jgi:DNA-directed RNA polymerase beta subunit
MEFLVNIVVACGAFGIPFIIYQMTTELRRIRIMMESHMQMIAVSVTDRENPYKRKGVEL